MHPATHQPTTRQGQVSKDLSTSVAELLGEKRDRLVFQRDRFVCRPRSLLVVCDLNVCVCVCVCVRACVRACVRVYLCVRERVSL